MSRRSSVTGRYGAEEVNGVDEQVRDRARGAMVGLAAGDAAGWPAAWHRSHRLVGWTRKVRQMLDRFADDRVLTSLPVPFALNQPVGPLMLGPGDDAEWAAFTALALLGASPGAGARAAAMEAAVEAAWTRLAGDDARASRTWARISVRTALGNLRRGLRPPVTGHHNPHHFDDAAAVRAVAVGVACAGDPAGAADLAETDAAVTQSGDGVHAARAMGAAVAAACGGASVDVVVETALGQLPEDSAVGRNVRAALDLVPAADGAFWLVPLLDHEVLDHVYSYGVAAADTLAVALAMTAAARGRPGEAIPAAACLARTADSAPALAGALCGALGGLASLPPPWVAASRRLIGCCLPELAGVDLVDLADRLCGGVPAH
ncbi:ADP-ribosylglycohydrolase family protein [Microtetraspora sp. NBRC 16547]|uniref:ADP-ribosylglycohydrolase family protein n=1 Tax=Microtetraspora sp. NBRC 16547 TaxID=3030993 RepID=UPI0024A1ACCC|nr:ADP-ribosylglycohydrolase family protein [Microtetraspora sp. NBRC 16547]GLX02334.1 hypothetical protein Misp02_64200 [Microtetraspora sp. NBRC 16547]